MKKNDRVVYVGSKYTLDLTKGKEYKIIDARYYRSGFITIKNDKLQLEYISVDLFKTTKELRSYKIDRLLNG